MPSKPLIVGQRLEASCWIYQPFERAVIRSLVGHRARRDSALLEFRERAPVVCGRAFRETAEYYAVDSGFG
jgi:hypothetical protein